jgi:hypothetical protein
MPWENPDEFEALRQGLIEENEPKGPLEQECIDTIASLLWRKRRVRVKRNLDTAAALARIENRVLWEDPPPLFDTEIERLKHALSTKRSGPQSPRDDYQQLLGFSTGLFGRQHRRLVQISVDMLPAEFKAYLNGKVPSTNFEDTRDWIVAL